MDIDYQDTPLEPCNHVDRKTGRVCKFCGSTGYMRGIRPLTWTEIHKTEEYNTLDKEEQRKVRERFKEDIVCTSCKAYERNNVEE